MLFVPRRLLALALALFFVSSSAAQVVVNEVLASNTSILAEPDNGEFEDAIELFNTSGADVDLGGFFLTDDLGNTDKWQIPAGTIIPANGYLIVWADNGDSGPPTTIALHTSFKLSASGEAVGLFDGAGAVVDTVSYGQQTTDVSYGRFPNGGTPWVFFAEPTLGAENNTTPTGNVAQAPTISLVSGFYAAAETVTLESTEAGAAVRYTLDGTEPTEASAEAVAPLSVAATTVLRAASFVTGLQQSPVVTRTYFVGENSDLPVFSIVTDPAGLFSDESGIYVAGTNGITGRCSTSPRNWNQDWERPVHLSFFESDGIGGHTLVMDQGAGVAIFGGCSRIYPQKSLTLHARGQYGAPAFDYRFFADNELETFDDLVLRSSAQDWWRTMFRDGMIQTVTRGMDIDGQSYRPTIVFLNGAYFGIHNLREKLNEDYVAGHYGYLDTQVEIVEQALLGRSDHYDQVLSVLAAGSTNDPIRYAQLESMLDIDQFLNYQIAEIYSANGDWPGNNYKMWRPTTPDGKWRWMFYDLDFGFGGNSHGQPQTNTLAQATATNGPDWPNPPYSTYLFRKLLENDGFRHTFIQRLAAHMNTTFEPRRVLGVIDSLKANIASEIPRHKGRWPQSISFSPDWDSAIDLMRTFATSRASFVRSHVYNYFDEVPSAASLHVGVTDGGHVVIEGVPIPRRPTTDPLFTIFFRGVPMQIAAVPDDGYVFAGWTGVVDASSDSVAVVLTANSTLTASFELASSAEAGGAPMASTLSSVYPNPASGSAWVEVSLSAPGALSVRVVDMLGRVVATLADGQYVAGTTRLAVQTGELQAGVYTVVMQADDANLTRRVTVVR